MYACEDCGKTYNNLHNMDRVDDVEERVLPGELMPVGQCTCRALIPIADADIPIDVLENCARALRARGWTVAPA